MKKRNNNRVFYTVMIISGILGIITSISTYYHFN